MATTHDSQELRRRAERVYAPEELFTNETFIDLMTGLLGEDDDTAVLQRDYPTEDGRERFLAVRNSSEEYLTGKPKFKFRYIVEPRHPTRENPRELFRYEINSDDTATATTASGLGRISRARRNARPAAGPDTMRANGLLLQLIDQLLKEAD